MNERTGVEWKQMIGSMLGGASSIFHSSEFGQTGIAAFQIRRLHQLISKNKAVS